MMLKEKRHPADHLLLAYCESKASAEETARLETHLRRCSRCRRWCEQVRVGLEAMRSLPIVPLDTRRAQAMQANLEGALIAKVASAKGRPADPEIVRLCLDRSHDMRSRDPEKMIYWARLACRVVERCDPSAMRSAAALDDLKARAWGQLGNALRIAGRLREAEVMLEKARVAAARGTGDLPLRIDLLAWTAILHRFERRFEEAIPLLDEAIILARAAGDGGRLAECLISKQIATLESGDAPGAIRILEEAIPLIDPADRRLVFAAQHNLSVCYLESGRIQEALELLPRSRALADEIGDALISLRSIWHEGQLLREIGRLREAEAQLCRARNGFVERDLAYEAALVALDLAAIYFIQGRTAEVRSTVAEVLPFFKSLKIERELLRALIQLQRAVDQDQALQLIRFLSRTLGVGPPLGRRIRTRQQLVRAPGIRGAPDAKRVKLYLDRSHEARYQDPKKMLHWARLARAAAERCDAGTAGGGAALSDLRARAWGQVGNALRVAGRLRPSAAALERATAYATRGSGDPSLRAQILSWTASLRMFERRFTEAITLLDKVANIHRQLGQHTELASCLSNKAIATAYSGHAEAAIGILNEALTLIDRSDLRLLLAINHNLIYCFIETGRLQEAQALFPQTRSLGEAIGDELVGLRLLWQEARILCELGMLEEAEAQFSRARQGFLERDLSYDAAVVSLDLTAVYVKLGLHAEVRRTIADILPIFSSLRVGRELLASLIQLQQAEDHTQALQLIRALSRELVAGPKLPPSV